MWIVVIVLVVALIVVIGRVRGQGAEKKAGYGPRCQFCRAKLKYNANRTGWARTCRKCGRDQVGK